MLLVGCATPRWRWDTFPGAHQKGHCHEYAEAVTSALHRANVEAYYTVVEWLVRETVRQTNGVQTFRYVRGAHAVVLFRNSCGIWFIVDNESAAPVPVNPGTHEQMVRQFAPYALDVRK